MSDDDTRGDAVDTVDDGFAALTSALESMDSDGPDDDSDDFYNDVVEPADCVTRVMDIERGDVQDDQDDAEAAEAAPTDQPADEAEPEPEAGLDWSAIGLGEEAANALSGLPDDEARGLHAAASFSRRVHDVLGTRIRAVLARGQDPVAQMEALYGLQDMARQDPRAYLKFLHDEAKLFTVDDIAEQFGLRKTASEGGAADDDDIFADPLEKEVKELRAQLAAVQQKSVATQGATDVPEQQTQLQAEIEQELFGTHEDGAPKYMYAADIAPMLEERIRLQVAQFPQKPITIDDYVREYNAIMSVHPVWANDHQHITARRAAANDQSQQSKAHAQKAKRAARPGARPQRAAAPLRAGRGDGFEALREAVNSAYRD